MNLKSKQKHLFSEFPSISTEEWLNKIQADLSKSATKLEDIDFHYQEDLDLKPFYRKEDLKKNLLYNKENSFEFPYLRSYTSKSTTTKIGAQIHSEDLKLARDKIEFFLSQEVELINIVNQLKSSQHRGVPIEKTEDLNFLLEEVDLSKTTLQFSCNELTPYLLHLFLEAIKNKDKTKIAKIQVLFDYDPLLAQLEGSPLTSHSSWDNSCAILSELILESELQNFSIRPVCISDSLLHNAGANSVLCLAYSLAALNEYFQNFYTHLESKNEFSSYSFQDILKIFCKHIYWHTAISTSYFVEMARIRAFRFLASSLFHFYCKEYAQEDLNFVPKIYIASENSLINKSLYDPYTNVLRNANECMAATLGGVDHFTCFSYDYCEDFMSTSKAGEKLAIHTQHMLQKESFITQVKDAAGGSYYIENLTDSLAKAAWETFQNIEKEGGLIESIANSSLQEQINKNLKTSQQKFFTTKLSILGTNKFPNPKEKILPSLKNCPSSKNKRKIKIIQNKKEIYYSPASSMKKPNLLHSIEKLLSQENNSLPIETILDFLYNKDNEKQESKHEILEKTRLAKSIEELRLATEEYALSNTSKKFKEKDKKNNKNFVENNTPKLFLLRWGHPVLSKQRANFVANFIACLGYEIYEGSLFTSMKEAALQAVEYEPNILAFCASDEDYTNLVSTILSVFKENNYKPYSIVAGLLNDKSSTELKKEGINIFLHRKSNLIDNLRQIQKDLGIIL